MDRLAISLFLCVALLGCTRSEPVPAEMADISANPPAEDPGRFDQPFLRAVTDEIGPEQRPPLERTIAGKSTATLREEVERIWPTIAVVDRDGKPIAWQATFETDAGSIVIDLRPDLAPNHVRNLIALIQAGYFDGLRFDRIVNQTAESPDGIASQIRMVRFGCPAGTGDPGVGHIGYRLRSEFSEEKHAAGTVGFTREPADPSSAGVRLYITQAPAPLLDGNYTIVGRVSAGMEVVEKIAASPLLPQALDPTREFPERPTVIQKATVRSMP